MDNIFINIKDRLDELHKNMEALTLLLHVIYEGVKSGNTGINEVADAIYAVYLLEGHFGLELLDIKIYTDKL